MNGDQAASALGNISPGDALAYWLAFLGIICLLGCAVAKAIDLVRWLRGGREQLERIERLAAADDYPVTREFETLDDFVVNPEVERWAAHHARRLRETRHDLHALDATEVIPTDWDGLGDVDPDWRLGGER